MLSLDTINVTLSILGGVVTAIGGIWGVVVWIKARGAAEAKREDAAKALQDADAREIIARESADQNIRDQMTSQATELEARFVALAKDVAHNTSSMHRTVNEGERRFTTPLAGLGGELDRTRKLVDDLRTWVETHVSRIYENLNKNSSDAAARMQTFSEKTSVDVAHLRNSVDVLSRGVTYLTESLKTQEQSVANLLADGAANEARLDALNAWRPAVEKQLLDLSKDLAGMKALVESTHHRRH